MSIPGTESWEVCDYGLAFEIVWHKKILMPNNYSYEIVY